MFKLVIFCSLLRISLESFCMFSFLFFISEFNCSIFLVNSWYFETSLFSIVFNNDLFSSSNSLIICILLFISESYSSNFLPIELISFFNIELFFSISYFSFKILFFSSFIFLLLSSISFLILLSFSDFLVSSSIFNCNSFIFLILFILSSLIIFISFSFSFLAFSMLWITSSNLFKLFSLSVFSFINSFFSLVKLSIFNLSSFISSFFSFSSLSFTSLSLV